MKILHINKHHYFRDGASNVYLRTARLLERHGHSSCFFSMQGDNNLLCETEEFFVSSVDLNQENLNFVDQFKIAMRFLYSQDAKKRISRLLDTNKIDLAHLHNIYHHISPSILHELKKRNIPVVMTMHDYKMACGAYAMLNKGQHCEDCIGQHFVMALKNKCVKNSYVKSFLTAFEMYLHHKILDIYDHVDVFIAPSRFQMNKLKEMGFKKEIIHLSNFVDSEEFEEVNLNVNRDERDEGTSIVYIGRVSDEKGLRTLIGAAALLSDENIKDKFEIKIIGDGPIKEELQKEVISDHIGNVRFLGYMKGNDLYAEIKKSTALVLPSECYENNPLSVLEAFALGKSVIGSRIAGIPELVKDDETGLTFESRNAKDLAEKIKYFIDHPGKVVEMGQNGRHLVERELSAETHYVKLMQVYQKAIEKNR